MTEAAPSANPPPKSGAWGPLLALLATLLLVIGFTLVSSLAAAVSENRYWMLTGGLFFCVVLPVILASWIRGIRRRRAPDPKAVRGPGSVGAIALTNLLLTLGPSLLLPAATAKHLQRNGAWWVEAIARGDRTNRAVQAAERTCNWVAELLPGEAPAPLPVSTSDGGSPGIDGTSPVRDGPGSVPDAAPPPEPAVAGEVRLRYEKQGTAVIVPVTVHGPSGHAAVKMLFDTGATLTTLNQATLRRLGVSVSSRDPTIETSTAAGRVRRTITVIESVTLAVARISGGVTVTVCEPCAQGEVVGLLGLNVLRHFKVTLDDEAGQVVLKQRSQGNPSGDLADIRPFIKLSNATGTWRGPMLTATATLHNLSPRPVSYIKLVAKVKKGEKVGKVWGEVRNVPPRGRTFVRLEGLSPVKGESFHLDLERADW